MAGNLISQSNFHSQEDERVCLHGTTSESVYPISCTNVSIPGIGDRLAKKIVEIGMFAEVVLTIATTGELQRLQNLSSSDHIVEMFMGVYGVGRTIALKWVMQGLRTLPDVLERGDVTENQRIGIELYDVTPLPIQINLFRTLRKEYLGRK
jgi:Fingers domain of DNA polymerase lambda